MRILHIVPTESSARVAGYRERRIPECPDLAVWWPGQGVDWLRGRRFDLVIVDTAVRYLYRGRELDEARVILTRFGAPWIEP